MSETPLELKRKLEDVCGEAFVARLNEHYKSLCTCDRQCDLLTAIEAQPHIVDLYVETEMRFGLGKTIGRPWSERSKSFSAFQNYRKQMYGEQNQ